MKPASAPAAVAAVGREGIEPLVVHLAVLRRLLYRQPRGTRPDGVARVRVELTDLRRFEFRRFSDLRTRSEQVAGPGVAPGGSGL